MNRCLDNSFAEGRCGNKSYAKQGEKECLISNDGVECGLLNIKLKGGTYKRRILLQAGGYKLLERLRIVTLQDWGRVFGDQEQDLHRMHVRIRRLTLCELYCRDA